MSDKLLPCPFCGCANDHCYKDSERNLWWALCNGCGARLRRVTKVEAIAAWNRRAPSERQAIVDWLLSMKRDDTNWPQHLAKRIERGEHLEAPSHE